MATSETARERDLYKYYQPWLDIQTLGNVPTDEGQAAPGQKLHRPQSSHDKALTAFAQLATLRLNVKRGMISLIDTNQQLIIAEATKSLSLVDDNRHAPNDHIWLGNVAIPRADAVCENVFGSTFTARDGPVDGGQEHTAEALVVPDLRLDERFKERPYVVASGAPRFYAGVPITTRDGNRIGVYAVSHTESRHSLTVDELRFMQDMAVTVFEHLEMVKSRNDRDRGEHMVRGIASFIEGLSNLKHSPDHETNGRRSITESPSRINQESAEHEQGRSTQESAKPQDSEQAALKSKSASVTDVTVPQSTSGSTHGTGNGASFTETDASIHAEQGSLTSDVREIFLRAAHIIRKSTRADGCVFFDTSSGIFGDDGGAPVEIGDTKQMLFEHLQTSGSDTDLYETPRRRRRRVTTSPDHSGQEKMSKPSEPDGSDVKSSPCQVLGMSLSSQRLGILPGLSMPENELKKCLQRYPYGKIFNFSDQGSVSSGDESIPDETIIGSGRAESDHHSRRKRSRGSRFLPRDMLKMLPGVRSVIFLPLWDYAQTRWFAGAFIWTDQVGHLSYPEGEMPYLKAFCSCIMSEVASMEALNTNRAKTTFIASISHELRSPLHGILGSIEFLEDTMTTAYQMNLLGAIETCGKTLLDTIDHLLDYAKINNLTKVISKRTSRGSLRSSKRITADISGAQSTLTAELDLASLVEDVLEAVFAGQTFRKARPRGQAGDHSMRDAIDHIQSLSLDDTLTTEEAIHAGTDKFSGKVVVVLNIANAANWWVKTQPGGLRRVIMNLFGNAIKYCEAGTIEANLDVTHVGKTCISVEFTVKDTGRGMSKEFMANHLFRAFAQEDSFSYGTGLGLSIVKQIVDSLGGKIDVKSQKNVGTEVKVSMKLPRVEQRPRSSDDDILAAAFEATKGLTMCLLDPGPDAAEKQKDVETSKLAQSLAKTCREWFDIEFIEGTSMEDDADIFFYAEPPPIEYLLELHKERKASRKTGKEVVLLVTCTNAFEAAALRASGVQHLTSLGRVVEVISQPCGPRKLAKVLLQCLRRVDAASKISPREHAKDTLVERNDAPSPSGIPALPTDAKERAAKTGWASSATVYDPTVQQHRPSIETYRWKSDPPPGEVDPTTGGTGESLEWGKVKAGDIFSDLHPSSPTNVPSTMDSTLQPSHFDSNGNAISNVPYILLVDDNPINLKLLVTFMKKIKLPYDEAVNGYEALEKFKSSSRTFDYVLMDISMPIMDGISSTRKIREYEKEVKANPATIIALTGLATGNVQEQAFEAGFSHFLAKPVRFKTLQHLLERK